MFGSFLLGLAGPLVVFASFAIGVVIIAMGGGFFGVAVILGGAFAGLYLRYLSKHTTRIRN